MRVPIPLALAAALVIATTAVLILNVLPAGTLYGPPYVYPSTSFQVAKNNWAVYYVSAHYIEARAGATAFWGIAEFVNTPVLVINGTIPPGTTLTLYYYSPLAQSWYTFYLVNDTNGVTYYRDPPGYTCSWYPLNGAPSNMPAIVYRHGDLVVVIPDMANVAKDWIALPSTGGIEWYGADGFKRASCGYVKTYDGTLGYSLSFDGYTATYVLPGGTNIRITARPFLIGTVRPTATTTVTISAS